MYISGTGSDKVEQTFLTTTAHLNLAGVTTETGEVIRNPTVLHSLEVSSSCSTKIKCFKGGLLQC